MKVDEETKLKRFQDSRDRALKHAKRAWREAKNENPSRFPYAKAQYERVNYYDEQIEQLKKK